MWIDVEQNTEDWFELRLGKVTSSNFPKIMANEGKAFGNPAIEYAQKVALEHVKGVRDERGYKGAYFDDGHDLEPIAIHLYEQEHFKTVTNGGFFDKGRFGDSNDGNVGEDGCIEVKSVIANTQWKRIKSNPVDTSYKWQIQGHLWVGNKQWCDFISYCPEMTEEKQLIVTRVLRDEDMISRLELRCNDFIKEVDENIKLLEG